MARVSTSITPDLLLPDKYNQQNLYSINGVDPGGGDQEFGDDDDVYQVSHIVNQNIPFLHYFVIIFKKSVTICTIHFQFHPDWRKNLGITNGSNSVIESSVNTNGHSNAAIFPSRCPNCRNWIGSSVNLEERLNHTQHILNGCRSFQNQGRYDWRHDAVLNFIGRSQHLYSNIPYDIITLQKKAVFVSIFKINSRFLHGQR